MRWYFLLGALMHALITKVVLRGKALKTRFGLEEAQDSWMGHLFSQLFLGHGWLRWRIVFHHPKPCCGPTEGMRLWVPHGPRNPSALGAPTVPPYPSAWPVPWQWWGFAALGPQNIHAQEQRQQSCAEPIASW